MAGQTFSPHSRWFSYGSNLSASIFEAKMSQQGSRLTLIRPQVAQLHGYQRSLSNRSVAHGLSYTVSRNEIATTEGIVHEVPIEELAAYLKMEGLFSRQGKARSDAIRTYDPQVVTVTLHGSNTEVLTLIGRLQANIRDISPAKYDELLHYVRTARQGAAHFGIESSDLDSDYELIRRTIHESRP